MKQKYQVHSLAKAGGVEVATLHLLNSDGTKLPGATLQISQPKGNGLFAQFDDGDVVEVTLEKIAKPASAEAAN